MGKSILESYSRVLESMAFNILARIDDLLYVDDLTKHSDRFPLVSSTVSHHHRKLSRPTISVSVSGTPHKSITAANSFSPAAPPLISPARGERTPFIHNNNMRPHRRGLGVKRVLSNYLGLEAKAKICSNSNEVNCSATNRTETEKEDERHKESISSCDVKK